MSADDPNTWPTLKAGFDLLRSAIGLVRETKKDVVRRMIRRAQKPWMYAPERSGKTT
jgi:hypothetical protein